MRRLLLIALLVVPVAYLARIILSRGRVARIGALGQIGLGVGFLSIAVVDIGAIVGLLADFPVDQRFFQAAILLAAGGGMLMPAAWLVHLPPRDRSNALRPMVAGLFIALILVAGIAVAVRI